MFENWELGGREAGGPLNVWRGSFGDPLMLQLRQTLAPRPTPVPGPSYCRLTMHCPQWLLQEIPAGGGTDWLG